MNIFKVYSYRWWEIGLLKISLIAFGILIGSYWEEFFMEESVIPLLWVLFIIPAVYLVIVSLKQIKKI